MRPFRAILALTILFISHGAFANGKFMPENDLWREDCGATCFNSNGMTKEIFDKILAAGQKAYDPYAQKNGERLVINNKWTDSTVNADCCRGCEAGKVIVNMYGGMARRNEINFEGFALVLGHELNHAYGGAPYYPGSDQMSAEGQSDYEGARTAYRKIAALVPELKKDISYEDYVGQLCAGKTGEEFKDCVHSLEGGKALGNLLAVLSGEGVPSYQTPDTSRVSQTETSYPRTVQCRVDTYLAGTLNKSRPACWFYDPNPNPTPTPQPTPTPWPTDYPTPNPTPNPTPFPTPNPTPEPKCHWCWECWTWHCDDFGSPWDWPW